MISEKRQEPRKRTFLKGRIHFNKGASSMDCLVRDFSEMGARLELSETNTLPETFDLYIPQKEITLRSNLRWRRGDAVGVAFAEVQKAAPSRPRHRRRTRRSPSCCAGSPSWRLRMPACAR